MSRRAFELGLAVTAGCLMGWWWASSGTDGSTKGVVQLMAEILKPASVFSLLALCILSGCWFWNRRALSGLREEVSRFVVALLNSRASYK